MPARAADSRAIRCPAPFVCGLESTHRSGPALAKHPTGDPPVRRGITVAIAAVLLLGPAASMRADTLPGSASAHEALALCEAAGDEVDRTARRALIDRGLALAEAAVEADDGDAAAHFAVFCNVGRRLELLPIGLGSLTGIGRVRREIDRALTLAPDSPAALTAKGLMLRRLPRLLGGDAAEGERLLRRALELVPDFAPARRALGDGGVAPPLTAGRQ
jgi:hypothetical protein